MDNSSITLDINKARFKKTSQALNSSDYLPVTFIDAKKDRNLRIQNSHRCSINDVTNDGVERNGSEACFTKRRKKSDHVI